MEIQGNSGIEGHSWTPKDIQVVVVVVIIILVIVQSLWSSLACHGAPPLVGPSWPPLAVAGVPAAVAPCFMYYDISSHCKSHVGSQVISLGDMRSWEGHHERWEILGERRRSMSTPGALNLEFPRRPVQSEGSQPPPGASWDVPGQRPPIFRNLRERRWAFLADALTRGSRPALRRCRMC